jgi:hypothetical protein
MYPTKLLVALLMLIALSTVGCSRLSSLRQPVSEARDLTRAVATSVANAVTTPRPEATPIDAPAEAPTDVSATPSAPAAPAPKTAPAAPAPKTAPATTDPASAAATAAIKQVIERGNAEQVEALAKKDPTVMQDTSTVEYYNQLKQTNQDLADNGVTTIKLVTLEWGPITLNGSMGATATSFETWQTTYADGTNDQSRDRNVYTLVLDKGTWKIQDDAHPDSGTNVTTPDTLPVAPSRPNQPLPGNVAPNAGSSRNWSGYVASKGTYTSVTGTWTIPQPSASRVTAAGATWVGIGGAKNHDLIQAGTEETVVGQNQVRYGAWIEMLPAVSHTISLKVSPGDSVTVTITQKSTDKWTITLKNNTTGQDFTATETYHSSLSSVEWIEEAPTGGRRVYPLDNFGTISFTGGSTVVGGKSLTISAAGAKPVSMNDSTGAVVAAPSKLASDGKGFTVTRVDSGSAPPSGRTQSGGLINPGSLLKFNADVGDVAA